MAPRVAIRSSHAGDPSVKVRGEAAGRDWDQVASREVALAGDSRANQRNNYRNARQ